MSAAHTVIIYSHGFGVGKDDRGLFTDIASALPDFEHVMFDYNDIDEAKHEMRVAPLDNQAKKLASVIAQTRRKHPKSKLNIIAHSQGCVVTAMCSPVGIQKTFFLAPPVTFAGSEQKVNDMLTRSGAVRDGDSIRYPRRDGSTTIVGLDYLTSRDGIVPLDLYSTFASQTELTVYRALHDEILSDTDYSVLSDICNLVDIDADHNFTGPTRKTLIEQIKARLLC